MRYALILAPLALAACSSAGGFIHPKDMTPSDRCYSARLVAAAMEANVPEGDTLERARANADLICSLVPEAAD